MSFIEANTTYYFTNLKGGTCVDLSGGDNTSIIGFDYHQGPNQTWTFENAGGDTFFIKSSGSGQYLSAAGDQPSDGQKAVAAGAPYYAWRVQDEAGVDGGVRIVPASNARYCLDLSNHGDSKPGTPIVLWSRWEGQNQVWKVQKAQ